MKSKNTTRVLFIIIQIIISVSLFSQENKKILEITKIEVAPKIDGKLDDQS